MKNTFIYIVLLFASSAMACGGYSGGDLYRMGFYNLFKQTNISATEFYPFLRDEYSSVYEIDYSPYYPNNEIVYPQGNLKLWEDVLVGWDAKDIEDVVYKSNNFNWENRNSPLEKSAKTYIEFAHLCSNTFKFRHKRGNWDYDSLVDDNEVDSEALISQANELLSSESNEQLKARYYYQIIRILHYSDSYGDAIRLYENQIENKLQKNEIYYYISDQVAGCYFAAGYYHKATYLFSRVLNKSVDRKKSAFLSFNLCIRWQPSGDNPYFNDIEGEKDLLLIKCLQDFSYERLDKFIQLDANDERIELLFMRELNRIESAVWPENIGSRDETLPGYCDNKYLVYMQKLAERQVNNEAIENADFWRIASSYLSFITEDIASAEAKLELVNSFPEQKKVLSVIYTIFSWKSITAENETYLSQVLLDYPKHENYPMSTNDVHYFILDKIANTYYKNGETAKAFLVHNSLEDVNNLNSIKLLDALEAFYYKENKSDYETVLLNQVAEQSSFIDYVYSPKGSHYSYEQMPEYSSFIDYINYQKGIYYLYEQNPEQALKYFKKNKSFEEQNIPGSIFSSDIRACFSRDWYGEDDEVYKADLFSFIATDFSITELTKNLIKLEKLTTNKVQWKAKLAHYLLGNYYFNISNTGYFRGLLTSNSNYPWRFYVPYFKKTTGEELIANTKGYNLSTIRMDEREKHYFGFADMAMAYYQKVIDLSTDKELNARCLYLMAKCELNDYYNNGGTDVFRLLEDDYSPIDLPKYKSFEILKEKYSETEFQKMIIQECSYYSGYCDRF